MAKKALAPSPIARMLLATDLGCRSDRAFYRACALAVMWRARLVIVTAVEAPFDEPSWLSQSAAMTDKVKAELGPELEACGIDWEVYVAPGSPIEVVEKAARRFKSQLIVTGVARNELLGRSRPGGTVEGLLRNAPAPVLTVKRRGVAPYRLALVPTDFTEAGATALLAAAAVFPDARFVLLHGYRVPFVGLIGEQPHAADFRQVAVDRQRAFAERIKERLHGRGMPQTLVEYGSANDLTARYEDTHKPDLIVIGAHEPHNWLHSSATGIAVKLVAGARCDVLIVPENAHQLAARPARVDRPS